MIPARRALLAAVLLSLAPAASATEPAREPPAEPEKPPAPPRPTTGASVALHVGWLQPQLSDLSGALEDAGLTRLPRSHATLGAGFLARGGRFLLGAEAHWLLARTVRAGDLDVEVSGSFVLGDLGFVIVDAGPLVFHGLVGLGAGGLSVRFSPRAAPPLQEFLDDPRRGGTLDAGGFLLQPALGLDLIPGGDRERAMGVTFGLRAGWMLRTGDGLSLAGQELLGTTDAGLTGPFVRLSVGFGGVAR